MDERSAEVVAPLLVSYGSGGAEEWGAAEPARAVLTPAERRHLLDDALHCLAELVATEQLMAQLGKAAGAEFAAISRSRSELGLRVQQARAAWRAEHHAPVVPPAAAASPAHAVLPAFTHTLGLLRMAVTEGPEVTNLQRLLNLEGIQVPVSGRYDGATTRAVRKLQQKHGLAARDGNVSGETRRLLNHLIGHGG